MPDPIVVGVLVNLASSALWELIRDPLYAEVIRPDAERGAWSETVEESLGRAEKLLANVHPADRETVGRFLESTEVRQLVRQIYYTRVGQKHVSLSTTRQAFAALWGRRHADEIAGLDVYGLFDALVESCEAVLDEAIVQDRSVAAHEAKEAARHQAVELRMTAIERQLRLLNDDRTPDLPAIDAFAGDVADAVAIRHNRIVPPSLQGAHAVPLDDLYVVPRFYLTGQDTASDYADVLAQGQRLVVLGSPGAGKTTFAQKLCLDLARGRVWLGGGVRPTLLFVELRSYAQELSRQPTSIRDYLARVAESAYQLDVPAHALEYLLVSGRLGVVFDGLDELPIISRRRDIVKNVEAFAARYAQSPIVVTSRVVGYEHASLDRAVFRSTRLGDFTRDQAAEYARRWFRLDERVTRADEAEQRAHDLLDETDAVPDLRANPLMLGLMCNLYRGRGFLPRNRPEVYDKCATLLFETWDKHRGIETLKPFEDLLRPTMRHLAYWIYSDENLQTGVTEHAAIDRTKAFLAEWRYGDDPRSAEHAARSFIDFCRGRAWVFSDLGADVRDEPVFQFTHRTFLEFFAAEQVVQDNETSVEVLGAIRPRILQGEWEVVTQLALQMQHRRHLGAADKMIEKLLASPKRGAKRARTVLFCGRALQSVVPRPETVRRVTSAVLDLAGGIEGNFYGADELSQEFRSIVGELWRCDPENRAAAFDAWSAAVLGWMTSPVTRPVAMEILVHAPDGVNDVLEIGSSETRHWWRGRLDQLRTQSRDLVLDAARSGDMNAAHDAWEQAWLTCADAVALHGPDFLWHNRYFRGGDAARASVADRTLYGRVPGDEAAVVQLLLHTPMPWFLDEAVASAQPMLDMTKLSWEAPPPLTVLLFAALAELPPRLAGMGGQLPSVRDEAMDRAFAAENAGEPAPAIVRALLARGDEAAAEDAVNDLASVGYEAKLLDVFRLWMRGETSFTRGFRPPRQSSA